jgi:ketosteroid isomerase-like protein
MSRFVTLLTGAMLALPGTLMAQQPVPSSSSWRADSIAVRAALSRFLTAFENLEWEPFRNAFSDSATVFHPAPDMPERVTGRTAVEASFAKVFAAIKAGTPTGPPFQRLEAQDLELRPLAPGVVLVSFHLRNQERLGRRTVIFRHEVAGWRIVHLHASNMSRRPGP